MKSNKRERLPSHDLKPQSGHQYKGRLAPADWSIHSTQSLAIGPGVSQKVGVGGCCVVLLPYIHTKAAPPMPFPPARWDSAHNDESKHREGRRSVKPLNILHRKSVNQVYWDILYTFLLQSEKKNTLFMSTWHLNIICIRCLITVCSLANFSKNPARFNTRHTQTLYKNRNAFLIKVTPFYPIVSFKSRNEIRLPSVIAPLKIKTTRSTCLLR